MTARETRARRTRRPPRNLGDPTSLPEPAEIPAEVHALMAQAGDGEISAAVAVADAALGAAVRTALPRMITDQPGKSPGHDAICTVTVEVDASAYLAERGLVLRSLCSPLCVVITETGTRHVPLSGRVSDLAWVRALHRALEPVLDRLVDEAWIPSWPCAYDSTAEPTPRLRAWRITQFSRHVQQVMRAAATEVVRGSGTDAGRAVRLRFGAASEAATLVSGTGGRGRR